MFSSECISIPAGSDRFRAFFHDVLRPFAETNKPSNPPDRVCPNDHWSPSEKPVKEPEAKRLKTAKEEKEEVKQESWRTQKFLEHHPSSDQPGLPRLFRGFVGDEKLTHLCRDYNRTL